MVQIQGKIMLKKPTYEELEKRNSELKQKILLRQQAENALKESDKRFRTLLQNSSDIQVIIDENGVERFVSESVEAITGYSPDDFIGKTGFEFVHPEDLETVSTALVSLKENSSGSVRTEYRHKKKDGSWVYLDAVGTNLLDDPVINGIVLNVRDVTEKKRAEKALKESEEKYRAVFENAAEAILIAQDSMIKFCNTAMETLLGYSKQELFMRPFSDFIHEDDLQLVTDRHEMRLKGQLLPSSYSFRVKSKGGGIKWVELSVALFRWEGSPATLCFMADITKLKQVEEDLKKSEAKYRSIIENMQDLFYRADLEGRLTLMSPSGARLLGYQSPEEMLGRELKSFYVNPEDRDLFLEAINENGGSVTNYEILLKRKDKTTLPFLASSAYYYDREGNVAGLEGMLFDITERRRTEEALMESESRYRSIIENIQEGYYEVDIAGNLKFFNEPLVRILGYPKHEMVGMNNREFTNEINAKKLYQAFNQVYQDGKPAKGFDWEIIRKDGAIRVLKTSVALIKDTDGRRIGFRGISRDVTEDKHMETQLQRAEKMETVGTLAGGVAHDLNNILSGLVSYPELLLLQLPEESPLRKPISTIQKSGQKAVAVVQDLLTLARRAVVVTEPLNLNEVILQYLESPEYGKVKDFHQGIQTVTKLQQGLLNMMGSPTHLSKTVMNLISNAAEAMPHGGRIIVSTKNQYIDNSIRGYDDIEEGDYVTLTVSDSGTGIHPADIDKIFEPFYTKKKMGRSGTGLGMAVVWGTVKDHQGYIDARSKEGEGTTFTLYFPATRQALAEHEPELPITEYTGKGELILVIDDVKQQRNLAEGMLRQLGYSVVSLPSGEEAVDYLRNRTVDLILLDMIMDPGMDGLDTYRKILKIHPGQRAIIASGFSETTRIKEAQHLGVGAYIKKPFLMEKLGMAVKEELAGSKK